MVTPTRMESLLKAIANNLGTVVMVDKPLQQISKKDIQEAVLKHNDAGWIPVASAWVRAWHILMDRMRRANAAEESINYNLRGEKSVSSKSLTILDPVRLKAVVEDIAAGKLEFDWQIQPTSMLERLEAAIILFLATQNDNPLFFAWRVEPEIHYDYRMDYNRAVWRTAWLNVAKQLSALGMLLAIGSTNRQAVGKYITTPDFLVIKDFDLLAGFVDDPLALFAADVRPFKTVQANIAESQKQAVDNSRKRPKTFGYVRLSKKVSDRQALLLPLYRAGAAEIFVDNAASAPEWDQLMGKARAGDLIIVLGLQYLSKLGLQSEQMLYQLLDNRVNLYVFGVGYLIHFKSGVLTNESCATLNLYHALLASMSEFMEALVFEKIANVKHEP